MHHDVGRRKLGGRALGAAYANVAIFIDRQRGIEVIAGRIINIAFLKQLAIAHPHLIPEDALARLVRQPCAVNSVYTVPVWVDAVGSPSRVRPDDVSGRGLNSRHQSSNLGAGPV